MLSPSNRAIVKMKKYSLLKEKIMELVIQEIKKNFGEKTVLKGTSFRAVGGKAFGLLGRNVPRYILKA